MKRVCIWGTSLKKVADEAQVLSFIQIVNTKFPEIQVTLFSQFGDLMTELLAKEQYQVRTIRTTNLFGVTRAIATADLLVFEGGPFYEAPLQAFRCLLLLSIAKTFQKPVVAYAATGFRFRTWWGKGLYRYLFDRMDFISVRENIGAEIIRELGIKKEVTCFADPRFVLTPRSTEQVRLILRREGISFDKPLIGITTRYLHERIPEWVKRSHGYTKERVRHANTVIAQITNYLAEQGDLILIPMHPDLEEDFNTAEQIKRHLPDPTRLKILSRRYNAWEILGIIQQCQMLFACRVGSAVLATVTGTPTIAVAYEPRMQDHMLRLEMERYVFDWKYLQYDQLLERVKELMSVQCGLKKDMLHKAEALKTLAWENADILNAFVHQK